MRDAQLSYEARLRRLERSLRRELSYLGFPAPDEADLEQLLRWHKSAVAELMGPRGRR